MKTQFDLSQPSNDFVYATHLQLDKLPSHLVVAIRPAVLPVRRLPPGRRRNQLIDRRRDCSELSTECTGQNPPKEDLVKRSQPHPGAGNALPSEAKISCQGLKRTQISFNDV